MSFLNSIKSNFSPKFKHWLYQDILTGLTKKGLHITNNLHELKRIIWHDLCAEYDSQNLYQYLQKSGLKFTDDFQLFLKYWQSDEWNHFQGFYHIYSLLSDQSSAEIEHQLNNRKVDFSPISKFLEDEFKICLLFAYDEIATTKSYSMDFDLYKSLGSPQLYQFLKLVTRDEAYHFGNILQVISRNHGHRIPEIKTHLQKLIDWDINEGFYQGTFVLSHEDKNYFTQAFLQSCAENIGDFMTKKLTKNHL
jgi:hypothetical protein